MLLLDDMRAEFARFLADDTNGKHRMDAALARVVTMAYEKGLQDGAAVVAINEVQIGVIGVKNGHHAGP